MIFYFSATGNSKYIASRIAKITGESLINIEDCIRDGAYDFDVHGGYFGIVVPTHFCQQPEIVREFMKHIHVENPSYTFAVISYYSSTGSTANDLSKYVKLDATFSVRMPDTWTPSFDLSDQSRIEMILREAETEIDFCLHAVDKKTHGNFAAKPMGKLFSSSVRLTYQTARRTILLSVDHTCDGCGLCAKDCPQHTIEMINNRPVFVKEKCMMCLRCLHRCPHFAIQYGDGKTRQHGQYVNPNVKL